MQESNSSLQAQADQDADEKRIEAIKFRVKQNVYGRTDCPPIPSEFLGQACRAAENIPKDHAGSSAHALDKQNPGREPH